MTPRSVALLEDEAAPGCALSIHEQRFRRILLLYIAGRLVSKGTIHAATGSLPNVCFCCTAWEAAHFGTQLRQSGQRGEINTIIISIQDIWWFLSPG
jgi:hypothetical protein